MSSLALDYRLTESDSAASDVFDVVIIGAGVSGACLFHVLRTKGYRVLLLDKADFAGGTSQASAMMLWGGLLYLRSLDLLTVYKLSTARDALVRSMAGSVRPRKFRYIVPQPRIGNRIAVQSALYLYWLLGGCRRSYPRAVEDFRELSLLKDATRRNCFEYEEAHLPDSDSRFVIQWVLRARDIHNPALNYCQIRGGRFDAQLRQWTLGLEDNILHRQIMVRTRLIVNAAGVWADSVNRQFGRDTPYIHVLSKGVFLGIHRHESHHAPIILAGEGDRDCFTLIPWGPVSLWGPTETLTPDPKHGFSVSPEDIHTLTHEYDRCFRKPLRTEDIVSIRCGVRGLAVPRFAAGRLSRQLSRKYVVHHDPQVPWVSIHGGKLTSCVDIAESAASAISGHLKPAHHFPVIPGPDLSPEMESFPGLKDPIPNARWCALESCWSLEDYLRRRTNVSQWVPRGGLGASNENLPHLERLAKRFVTLSRMSPAEAVTAYRRQIESSFDRVLSDWANSAVSREAL